MCLARMSGGAKLARFLDVSGDLMAESLDTLKFFLRAEKLHEFNFDISAIDVAMEIEEMNFDRTLGFFARNRRPEPDIHDAVMEHAFEPGFDKVNAIGRKLFAVRA